MQCDAMRAGEIVAPNQSPCLIRRGIFTGIAAASAAGLMRPAAGPYDPTVQYLKREFFAVAGMMSEAEGKVQITLFARMTKIAGALSVIPAEARAARMAKKDVATWSMTEGGSTLRLPFELVTALNIPD